VLKKGIYNILHHCKAEAVGKLTKNGDFSNAGLFEHIVSDG
jgi:hypothetical protein